MPRVEIDKDLGILLGNVASKIREGQPKAMLLAAEHAAGEIRREVFETFKGGRGGLARSFVATMLTSPKKDTLRSGGVSDLVYADIQDRGGVIRPRTRKFLSVPIGDRARRVAGLWPRDWGKGEFFAFKAKSGKVFLARTDRKPRQQGYLQYVLQKAVRIKPTRYLERAAKEAEPEIKAILGDEVQIAIDRAES